MKKLLIVFLILDFCVNHLLDDNIKNMIRKEVLRANHLTDHDATSIITFLENNKKLKFLEIKFYRSYPIILKCETEKNEEALYYLFIDDEKWTECSKYEKGYETFKDNHPENIIRMESPTKTPFLTNNYVADSYVCGIEMEYGVLSMDKIFTQTSDENKKVANTAQMYQIVLGLLEGFDYIQYVTRNYHGIAHQDNWIIAKDEHNNLIPKIKDFNKLFQHPNIACRTDKNTAYYDTENNSDRFVRANKCNPGKLKFTLPNCPPELKNFWKKIVNSVAGLRGQDQTNYVRYRWNIDFKEEVYALGFSIEQMIRSNKDELCETCDSMKTIHLVTHWMTKSNINERCKLSEAIKKLQEETNHLEILV